jgi:hypothetical protein
LATLLAGALVLLAAAGPAAATTASPRDESALEDAAAIFERSTGEMAGRLSTLNLSPERDYPALLKAAQRSIVALAERMSFWGPDRLAALAPPLEFLSFPPTADPYLEAATRFDACKVYLQSDFDDPSSLSVSDERRLTAAMGTVYLDIASWFLHNSFLATGGRSEEADRFFEDPLLAFTRVQLASNPELRQQSRHQCGPVLEALFGANPFDEPTRGDAPTEAPVADGDPGSHGN